MEFLHLIFSINEMYINAWQLFLERGIITDGEEKFISSSGRIFAWGRL